MKTAIFCLLIFLAVAQHRLNYLEEQDRNVNLEVVIEKFVQLQAEVYRKVFQHYIVERIALWKAEGVHEQEVKERVLLLLTDPSQPLIDNLNEYMQKKLFSRLGI
jgi:hypothetical protein